jgi:hypothetical protein
MPLLDHFHPPLADERHWESFHSTWAAEIMAHLNQGVLPAGYFAEAQIHLGGRVEVDVASFVKESHNGASNGGVALQTEEATQVLTMPATFPDEIEVLVIHRSGGPTLVGAIELVSPANKDRPETRRAFAAKCAAYLHAGVGLVVVDVVTDRQFNLHDELIDLLRQDDSLRFPAHAVIYVVAYRPVRDPAQGDQIEMRPLALQIGRALPTTLLALRNGPLIPVDLETTYAATRKRSLL